MSYVKDAVMQQDSNNINIIKLHKNEIYIFCKSRFSYNAPFLDITLFTVINKIFISSNNDLLLT